MCWHAFVFPEIYMRNSMYLMLHEGYNPMQVSLQQLLLENGANTFWIWLLKNPIFNFFVLLQAFIMKSASSWN